MGAHSEKPRSNGITMVMDKGLSIRGAEDLIEVATPYVDYVKLGFGTGILTPNTEQKVRIYRSAGIEPYLGGTLFERYLATDSLPIYKNLLHELGITTVEISDGSISIPHERKCEFIREFTNDFTVISEVGSKHAALHIDPKKWVTMMKAELEAGAKLVIAEAREGGNIGIYNPDCSVNTELVDTILKHVPVEKVLWEAPVKKQQVWFIKLLGSNVNLGNIAPNEIIALEALRTGLRGDTFFTFLPEEFRDSEDLSDN